LPETEMPSNFCSDLEEEGEMHPLTLLRDFVIIAPFGALSFLSSAGGP